MNRPPSGPVASDVAAAATDVAATGIASAAAEAVRRLHGLARPNVSLGPLTTYRVGGAAAVFAAPRSLDELRSVAATAVDLGLELLVVGRGSNMLVADGGFAGVVVSLAEMANDIGVDGRVVVAGAAVALPVLARRTAAAGLRGFEWAVGVPGSIGGAVRMNAGGHGSDMAAVLLDAHVLDVGSGTVTRRPAADLGLRFRGSGLSDCDVVLDARLALAAGDVAASEAEIADIVRWRREHQPGGQNAGSVFINPIPGELAAAELIDRVALRGFTIGGASVSDKHANFIQATDGAAAADVHAVIEHVRRRVAEASGFVLRSEVRLVGFADTIEHGFADQVQSQR